MSSAIRHVVRSRSTTLLRSTTKNNKSTNNQTLNEAFSIRPQPSHRSISTSLLKTHTENISQFRRLINTSAFSTLASLVDGGVGVDAEENITKALNDDYDDLDGT